MIDPGLFMWIDDAYKQQQSQKPREPSSVYSVDRILAELIGSSEPTKEQIDKINRDAFLGAINSISNRLLSPVPTVGYTSDIIGAVLGVDRALEETRARNFNEQVAKLNLARTAQALQAGHESLEESKRARESRDMMVNKMRASLPIIKSAFDGIHQKLAGEDSQSAAIARGLIDSTYSAYEALLEYGDVGAATNYLSSRIIPFLEKNSVDAATGVLNNISRLKGLIENNPSLMQELNAALKPIGHELGLNERGEVIVKDSLQRKAIEANIEAVRARSGEQREDRTASKRLESVMKDVNDRVNNIDSMVNIVSSYRDDINSGKIFRNKSRDAIKKEYDNAVLGLRKILGPSYRDDFIDLWSKMSREDKIKVIGGYYHPEVFNPTARVSFGDNAGNPR